MLRIVWRNMIILMVLFTAPSLCAQQAPQYTMHMFHKYQFNPAFGGLERSLSLTTVSRTQWTPITQNPTSQVFSAHLPFYLINGGIGVIVENETLGLEQNTGFQLSYNYVKQTKLGIFSGGLGLGILRKELDGSGIITPEGSYVPGTAINHNDPILPTVGVSGVGLEWRLGVYYVGKYFKSGLSVDNIPSSFVGLEGLNLDITRHYTWYVETRYNLKSRDISLIPSLYVLANAQEIQTTLSCVAEFGNILAGIGIRGFNSRSLDGLNFIMGMQLNKHFRLLYSYDYGLSSLQTVSDGTHEFSLNYNLQKLIDWGLPPKVRYNPRNL